MSNPNHKRQYVELTDEEVESIKGSMYYYETDEDGDDVKCQYTNEEIKERVKKYADTNMFEITIGDPNGHEEDDDDGSFD